MESQKADGVPVSLVLLDNGHNLTFSGTLVLSASNGTDIKPTKMPYDGRGAGMFTIVVIAVYCFSIVLFIASFIKKKKGITVEAEENNTVTQYLTQVPVLKEKTAREHFKKLKMGIIERVESDNESKSSFSNRFRDKRMKGPAEMRQPLLDNEFAITNCVGSKPSNNLETCSKLVQALHSIKEVEEITDFSKSSSESYTPTTGITYDPLGNSYGTTELASSRYDPLESSYGTTEPSISSPLTPGYPPDKYYRYFTFNRQKSDDTGSCATKDVNWEEVWLDDSEQDKVNDDKRNDPDKLSEVPLVPLPPPPAFQQGYHQNAFQNNSKPKMNFSDSESVDNSITNSTDFTCKFNEPFVQVHNVPGMSSANQLDSSSASSSVLLSPRPFRGKRWPPSPSLGQAARAKLAPRSQRYTDAEWEGEDFVGTNGISLKVLDPWNPECVRAESPAQKSKETRITLEPEVTRTDGRSTISSL